MVRIAPVRLEFNPKTLWFDAEDLELHEDDAVVVSTARGEEFGHVYERVFDMAYEDTQKLKSPLKPVLRLATEEDAERQRECEERARQALPIFKQIAAQELPDMHPVAVEYLFEGDKAVFYFEAEDRVDFRELVRKLAAEFHVRIDMKQIGVRDGARIVGAIGHCGQVICCRRLGGEFNPVSIRMAKEQDLSLNPQKISGLCGRLMCCLRYEYDAYKDFHSRAPKKNARIKTPDGEGKVVELDVPRETVSIKVDDEKPVKVPLADMQASEEGARPNAVGKKAWEKAQEPQVNAMSDALHLFGTSQLAGDDKLAEPGQIRHVPRSEAKEEQKSHRTRRRRGSRGNGKGNAQEQGAQSAEKTQEPRKQRRRRSTTVSAEGAAKTEKAAAQKTSEKPAKSEKSGRSRSRRGGSGSQRNQAGAEGKGAEQKKNVQVGRNSSALRANRENQQAQQGQSRSEQGEGGRRRRRPRKK